MQYILSEHEMNRGCELIEAFETEETDLDTAYYQQNSLNDQGYFTVIHCVNVEKDLYKISVFQRNK